MDRKIVYPGAIPLDTDVLSVERNVMIALGWMLQAMFGTNTGIAGLPCTPTIPASMTVNVGPGAIWAQQVIDQNNFGSLAPDASPLMKMGILPEGAATSFTLTAPVNSGQSINYLVEAAFQEADTDPVVLPYVNPANPSQPYSGPSNSGTAQNTVRAQTVQLQLKAGTPANTGTQTTPAVDNGYVGLYVITVNYGQTTVVAADIVEFPGAPFAGGPFAPATGNANQAFAVGAGGFGSTQALQAQQILNAESYYTTESTTITPTALYNFVSCGNISGDITVTINGVPPTGGTIVVFGSATGSVEVTVPEGTQIIFADGSVANSYTIPMSFAAGIQLSFNNSSCLAQTFGNPIVLPATKGNQAVALGQFSGCGAAFGSNSCSITFTPNSACQILVRYSGNFGVGGSVGTVSVNATNATEISGGGQGSGTPYAAGSYVFSTPGGEKITLTLAAQGTGQPNFEMSYITTPIALPQGG